eukprot:scaffold4944_cov135-Isochrysis_galbana.AAC.12
MLAPFDAEMLPHLVRVIDEIIECVPHQAVVALRLAATSLIKGYDAVGGGVEKARQHAGSPSARPAVQVDNWGSRGAAKLTDKEPVAVGDTEQRLTVGGTARI